MEVGKHIERIKQRDFTVGIIGLGYVGLPLILEFSHAGFPVLGLDVDPSKIEALSKGKSYIGHIPDERIQHLAESGKFSATTDFARCIEADALLICVPTPITAHREPDLSYIVQTGRAIAPHLRDGALVVLESTTYPTTTDEVLRAELEANGKQAGVDFLLAYSPEREDPGNADFSTGKIPKVVGGYDAVSLEVADTLYRQVVPTTVPVSSTRTAEAVKLTENIFRSVNIALVNELKLIYAKMGIDIWEVIEAAKTKPFGYMPFYPGPGLGGHCIPIDPFYLTWKAREYEVPTRFIELAGEINTSMPDYVVEQLVNALNDREKSLKGSKILLVGLAYKKNIGDIRESPALALLRILSLKHATVDYYDPHAPVIPPTREFSEFEGIESIAWDLEGLASYDAAIIVTDHDGIDYAALVEHTPLVVDTRNATRGLPGAQEKVVQA